MVAPVSRKAPRPQLDERIQCAIRAERAHREALAEVVKMVQAECQHLVVGCVPPKSGPYSIDNAYFVCLNCGAHEFAEHPYGGASNLVPGVYLQPSDCEPITQEEAFAIRQGDFL